MMVNKYMDDLMQDALRVGRVDLYPTRCREVIFKLAVALHNLQDAAEALGALPDGYCFCSADRHGEGPEESHEPECRDLRAALKGESHE